MDCRQIRDDISSWSDNELEKKRIQTLVKHIQTCDPCQRHCRETFALGERLNNLPLAHPSSFLRRRTLSAFETLQTAPPLSLWWKYAGTGLRSAALGMAAAGLILGFIAAHKAMETKTVSQKSPYIIALNESPGGLL